MQPFKGYASFFLKQNLMNRPKHLVTFEDEKFMASSCSPYDDLFPGQDGRVVDRRTEKKWVKYGFNGGRDRLQYFQRYLQVLG